MARRVVDLRDVSQPADLQKLRDLLLDLYGYAGLKKIEGRVETTDATVTTLLTLPLEDNKTTQVAVDVVARRTGGSAGTAGDGASYRVLGTFRRVSAGNATLVGSLTADHTGESQSGWDATLAVSGTDVLVRCTGAINNNVSWATLATLQTV